MKILSWNVNGLRSVYAKGFLDFLEKSQTDIVCLQEIKVQKDQLPIELTNPLGYASYFNFASKKGYSGTAVYTKQKPLFANNKIGFDKFDAEGRFLEIEFSEFALINLYLPHGGRSKEKLGYKLDCYEKLFGYLRHRKKKNAILIGDFNIAHTEIDLARPRANRDNIMFTPEERRQIDKLINLGFTDTFRKYYPNKKGCYTWWPYYANARARNLGWRIDYTFISKSLSQDLKNSFILTDVKGSDHCPIGVEIS